MQPFTVLTGPAAPMMLPNVDTDVIIRIERLTAGDREALRRHAFEALRYRPDGSDEPGFVFNQPPFRGAPILLAGPNFGCGSSREGAVWALQGMGVRCVIADGFGDIFYSNCFQNGVLPIRLPEPEVVKLAALAKDAAPMTVDLKAQTVTLSGAVVAFDIDPLRKEGLLQGLDDVGLSLLQMDAVRDWQARDRVARPWVWAPVQRAPAADPIRS